MQSSLTDEPGESPVEAAPPRGHWGKKAAGQEVTKNSLPDPENDFSIEIRGSLENGRERPTLSEPEYAALYGHFHLFRLRGVRLKPEHPSLRHVIGSAVWKEEGLALAGQLLKMGINPNDQPDGGCSEIHSLLSGMAWGFSSHSWGGLERKKHGIDDENARQKMRALHFLVKHGARWRPTDASGISDARRSLAKMTPDYTVEFVWIMSRYRACSKESILELTRTPRMRSHLLRHRARLSELLATWDEPAEAPNGAVLSPSYLPSLGKTKGS